MSNIPPFAHIFQSASSRAGAREERSKGDRVKNVLLSLICVMQLGVMGSPVRAYDYPFKDPYVATIIGTPEELQPKPPEKIDYELLSLKVFPDRSPPDIFWYQRDFRYSLTYQKGEAPLIFVIAGTGSAFYSSSMIFLQKVFYYEAGFQIERLSFRSIESYLRNTSKIILVENEDDLILKGEDLTFLKDVFGSRAQIYPFGGHCGNMRYKDNVEHLINFFKN